MIRTLVVDDDRLVRKGFISIMPWAAYGIVVVGDVGGGEEALEFLLANHVDLLITDIVMPVMTGLELIREVKKLYPRVWIVLLTFHQEFNYVQEALRLGALDYIVKTQLEKEQLSDVLARIVGRIQSDEAGRQHPAAQAGGAVDEATGPLGLDTIQELVREWSSFLWIHNDRQYRDQLDRIRRLAPPVSSLETVFYSSVTVLRKNLMLLDDTGPFIQAVAGRSLDGWFVWIDEVRSFFQKKTKKPLYSEEVSQSIMKALDRINGAVEENLNQEDIAREVNISRSYFSQCFRDIVGIPFNEYVRDMKMQRAKHLLELSDKPVYWIADKLGYQSEKYFSRVFREKYHMLPTEYRNRNIR